MRRAASLAVVCAVSAAVLTGCGDGAESGANGVGDLPPERIEAKALKAADRARSVRLAGSVESGGESVRLDMRLSADGGMGEVSTAGDTFTLLRVGEDLYLKANDDFWLEQDGSGGKDEPTEADIAAAQKLDGKYVKVPEKDSAYEQLSGFTDMKSLLGSLLKLGGELETDGNGEIRGVSTVRLTADGGRGGSLEVSLEGPPYPLRLKRAGGAGEMKLLDWNEEFQVSAPREEAVVDYGKKISSG